MNEERSREILKEAIQEDGSLYHPHPYIEWITGDKRITIDGRFNLKELKALIYWVENEDNRKLKALKFDDPLNMGNDSVSYCD
jgi:hypothetical protein